MLQGHVYHKESGLPLCGVPVSDGRHVVKTDAAGRFSLPGWERAHLVYLCLLTHAHDDWYAMLEDHEGDFDFSVLPVDAEPTHSFLHLSDTEIGEEGCGAWLDGVKEYVAAETPAFLLHTGDICRKAGLARHYLDMNEETVGCPVRYTLGNHDYVDEKYGEHTYEKYYGPAWYSFVLGQTHYVVLPIPKGEAPSGYELEDSVRWLKNELAVCDPSQKLVVLCHDLCRGSEEDFVLTYGTESCDLKEHNLLAWVLGHLHSHYVNDCNGIYNICTANPACGGIDSSPAALRRVTIHEGQTLSSTVLYYGLERATVGDAYRFRTALSGHVLFCTPLLEGDRLWVATADDGFPKRCGIYCLSSRTGEVIWEYPSLHSFKNEMRLCGDRLYALNAHGDVLCLSAEDGSLLWETPLQFEHPHHTMASLAVLGGRVFAQTCSNVVALSADDGRILWQTEHFRMHAESPVRMLVHDGRLIVGKQWGMLYALDPETGARLWENKAPSHRVSLPLAVGDELYVTHLYELFRLDAKTGETLAVRALSDGMFDLNTAGAPVLCGRHLLVPSAGGGLLRVDPETMAVTGQFPCDAPMVPATPYETHNAPAVEAAPLVSGNDVIYVGSDGYLRVCDVETLAEKRRIFVGAPSYVSVTAVGDTLITADLCGRITAY